MLLKCYIFHPYHLIVNNLLIEEKQTAYTNKTDISRNIIMKLNTVYLKTTCMMDHYIVDNQIMSSFRHCPPQYLLID